MKRLISIILFIALALTLAACGETTPETSSEAEIQHLQDEIARLERQIKDNENDSLSIITPPLTTTTPPPTTTTPPPPVVVSTIGERQNPVPLGQAFTTEYLRYRHSNEVIGYTIKITDLIRGDAAMELALTWNQFNNRDFPEDRDLILFYVEFTLNKYSNDRETDPNWLASRVRFKYFNGDYSEIKNRASIVTRDGFHAQLFEGASTSGWLYTTVAVDDFYPTARYDDRVWLALY